MRSFLTGAERQALRETYIANEFQAMEVFNFNKKKQDEVLEKYLRTFDQGVDIFNVKLSHLKAEDQNILGRKKNKDKLMQILEGLTKLPKLDFSHLTEYIFDALKLEKLNKGFAEGIEARLNATLEKMQLFDKAWNITNRFPLLISGYQTSHLLVAEKKELITLKPQLEFFKNLSYEDVAKGNIDFIELNNLNKKYTSLSASILTLLDIQKMENQKGHSFMPIVNPNFGNWKKFDFKGIVEQIPDQLYKQITALDPRIYSLGHEGLDVRNWLTTLIMTPGAGHTGAANFCELLQKGKFEEFSLQIDHNILLNIAHYLKDSELIQTMSSGKIAETIFYKDKTIRDVIRRSAEDACLPLTEPSIKEAADEISKTGYLVSFRHMRKEHDNYKVPKIEEAMNPALILIDPINNENMMMPFLDIFGKMCIYDLDSIIKQGPKKMQNGKKFYNENKEFYEKFNKDPGSKEIFEQKYAIARKIFEDERMKDKKFKTFMEQTFDGIDHASSTIMAGIIPTKVMRYVSQRFSTQVILEEIKNLQAGELLLGYSMNNCLSVMDLMRYHANNDASIYCLWLDGMRVGMSYDLKIKNNLNGNKETAFEGPLIDSIEISDLFFKKANQLFKTKDGTKLSDSQITSMFTLNYLTARLLYSETGLFVLPESNNYHVMETMQAFIDAYEGKPVLQYEGNWVQTDTDFKKIPYWVDKEQLKGNIKQSYVDKGKHKKSIKLNKKKETESSLLKPEANIYYDELVKRVVEGGKKK